MAYITKWLIPYRVLFTYHYGVSTAAEVRQNMEEMADYVNEGIPFIHYIVDGTDVTKNDFSMNDLKSIFSASPSDGRMGWTCSVTPSTLQRFFSAVIFKFAGARGRSCSTVEDALKFLAESDNTIPSYEEMVKAYHDLKVSLKATIAD